MRIVAAAALLVTLQSTPSHAQYVIDPLYDPSWLDPYACPFTADQCLDPDWQESDCGRQQIAAGGCASVIESTMSTAPTLGYQITRNEVGDYLYADQLVPTGTSNDYDYSWGPSYLGEISQYAAEQRNGSLGWWVWWKPSKTARRAEFDANGLRVGSCEELAYEGWWTYSKFEDEVATRGTDARAIFDAARVTNLGASKIRDREGNYVYRPDLSIVPGLPFPTSKIPKNAYFLFQKTTFDKYPIPESAIPSSAGRSYYDGDWAWHLSMDQQLRDYGWPDEILDGEYERQKRFLKLLDRRARLLDKLVEEATAMPITAPDFGTTDYSLGTLSFTAFSGTTSELTVSSLSPTVASSLVTASTSVTDPYATFTGGYTGTLGSLYALDAAISRELEWAASIGCLDTTAPSVCDWSPRLFADLVGQSYVKEREEEYQRCLYLTGDDFSDGSPMGNPAAFGLPVIDYRKTAWLTRAYLIAYENYLKTIDFATEPGSPTTPSVGWWRDGGRWLGGDEWGAGYSYKFGFGLLPGEEGGKCVMNFKAQAYANASATVAGKSIGILDSDTYGLTVSDTEFKVHSHTTLLGSYSLYTPFDKVFTGTDSANVFHLDKEYSVSALFWIGPVPVTGEIGIAGKAGLDVGSTVALDRNCYSTPRFHLTGQVTAKPYVDADAFIGALVGAKGLGAGLRTDLQVAHVEAPMVVTATVHGEGSDLAKLAAATVATVSVDLGLTVDSLGGTVSGVVETPFKTWKKTLFQWEGKRLVDEKWTRSWRFPMAAVLSRLGA